MSEQQRIPLGDLDDLGAYVGKIVKAILAGHDFTETDLEELFASGIELAAQKNTELGPGQSLQEALSGWLERRLRDVWRKNHREWRRNTRAGTTYSLPVPTGLSWEHKDESGLVFAGTTDSRTSESRMNLAIFTRLEDLFDPKKVGRSQGMPSLAAIATQTAREIYATLIEEHNLTTADTFVFGSPPSPPKT